MEDGLQGGVGDAGGSGENCGDDLLVLFRLEGAGGVKEAAAGSQAGQGGGENLVLAGGLASEVRRLETMLYLWVTAESSSATTGYITEDEVEEAFGCGELGGVGFEGADVGCSGLETGGEGLETAGVGVGGEDLGVEAAVSQDEGLATGRGAAIPDAVRSGMGGGGQLGDQTGTVVEVREGRLRRGGLGKEGAGVRLLLVVGAEREGGGAAVVADPAGDEPLRMGKAFGENCSGLVELRLGGLLAGELAEDRVDHAGCVAVPCGPGQFDGFAESRVGGDAVEVLELEGSHAEGRGNRGGEGQVGALEERLHASVEGDLPAEDPEDEGGGKVAVGLREGRHAGSVEQVVRVRRGGGNAVENGEGGGTGRADGPMSGGGVLHRLWGNGLGGTPRVARA